MIKQKLVCVVVVGFLTVPLLAKVRAPLPDKLLGAKTVYLENWSLYGETIDDIYEEFQGWNRFKVVTDKSKADLVVVVSAVPHASIRSHSIKGESGYSTSFSVPVFDDRLHLFLIDRETGDFLWTDSEAGTGGAAAKSLIKKARKRIEGQ